MAKRDVVFPAGRQALYERKRGGRDGVTVYSSK